jgi:hypothetical protein
VNRLLVGAAGKEGELNARRMPIKTWRANRKRGVAIFED